MSRPLYKKLGIKGDSSILILNSPNNYLDFFSDFPYNVVIHEICENEKMEFVHIFVTTMKELEQSYALGKSILTKNGMLWISWPKKSSSIESELSQPIIMKYVYDNGLVETKVVAIDETWSALKFVYRVVDR